ncbi:MAG: PASTA domain-containing protein [Alistipes sp.]|nr:PASTA domain-containing protein [Alistipes sp.]
MEEQDRPRIKEEIHTRVKWLYVAFFCVGLLLTGRLVHVMFFSREIADNAERLHARIFQKWEIPAMRGSILSRDGEPLATSMFRYQVEMDFASRGFDSLKLYTEQADSLAKHLALFFRDRTARQYRDFLLSEHRKRYRTVYRRDTQELRSDGWFGRIVDRMRGEEYVTRKLYDTIRDSTLVPLFPRRVDYYEWQELSKYPILNNNLGICYRLDRQDQRIYPQGELARRTIGKSDDRGRQYGIEDVCREQLAGRNGRVERQRIARGFYSRVAGGDVAPEDGVDVVTTIDLDLQDVADKALRQQLVRQNAIWGTTMVMEVATGDILALVNLGRTDRGYVENRNYALAARMEPGSTFKLAALLALTEDAGKDLSLSYDSGDGRVVQVGGAKVQDSHSGFSVVDLKTATAQSLNVYYAKAIYEQYRENPKRYTDFLSALHLDRPMGLEEFGEAEPVFPTPGSAIWYRNVTLPNMGYGYGIELAPIQTLTLYNAVANGGRMVAPRLVRELRRGRETVEEYAPRTLVRSICSDEALRKVRECLEETPRTGTAKAYFSDTTRYRVGAKTGTAKVAQGSIRYSDGYYLGSMVVYMPAEKPKYTVMTAIYTRRGNGTTYYGAGLAGPVQKQIADYIYNREHDWHGRVERSGGKYHPRHIKSGDVAQARRVADKLSPRTSFESRSGWGRVAVDSMSNVSIVDLPAAAGTVPDVRGMGLKEALFLLENAGLRVSFRGKGAVASQSIAPGARCRGGEKIEIVLK